MSRTRARYQCCLLLWLLNRHSGAAIDVLCAGNHWHQTSEGPRWYTSRMIALPSDRGCNVFLDELIQGQAGPGLGFS